MFLSPTRVAIETSRHIALEFWWLKLLELHVGFVWLIEKLIYHHLEAQTVTNKSVWRTRDSRRSSVNQLVSEYTDMGSMQRVGWQQTPALLRSVRSMVAVSKRGWQRQLKQFQLWFGSKSLECDQENVTQFLVLIHQELGMGILVFFLSIMQCVIHRNLKKCAHWTYQKSNDSRGGSLTTATVYQLRQNQQQNEETETWHELKLSIPTRKGNWVLENRQDASPLSRQYHQPRLNTRSARSDLIFVRQWQHVLF